jgi:hypothetical protein
VLDIDPAHGGRASLNALINDHGSLPAACVVRTGSDGCHLYFARPDFEIRNNVGTKLGPGIDVRGEGGYVIAPPSRHAFGALYRWERRGRDLPALPHWLVDRLRETKRARAPTTRQDPAAGARSWAQAAVGGEIALVLAAAEGRRNHTLNRASFCLGQVVAGTDLDPYEVELLLVEAGLAVGLTEREVRVTVRSGMDAGLREPRYPARRDVAEARTDVDLRTIKLEARDSTTEHATPEDTSGGLEEPDLPGLDA